MACCHRRLGTHNLDMLILFVKNWLDESHVCATPHIELVIWKALVKLKNEYFLKTLDAKCSNDVNAHIEECVQD